MGVVAKGDSWKQRKRMNTESFKKMMGSKYEADIPPINTKESICQKCGFKARYQFLRCPECNEVQK